MANAAFNWEQYQEVPPAQTTSMASQNAAPAPAFNWSDYQEAPAAQTQPPSMGLIPSIGAHVLADTATLGSDILNVPHNIDNSIPGYEPNFNYYNALGVQPNLADKIGTGIASYAPYDTGAGELVGGLELGGKYLPALARNVGAGAAYGAANSPNSPLGGEVGGAGLGVANTALSAVGGLLGRGATNLYAKTALPGLIDQGTQAVMKGLGNAGDYASQLLGKYKDADAANANAWNTATQNATNLDSQLTANKATFNAQPYNDYITNYLGKVNGMEPATAYKYNDAVDFANNVASKIAPQSFSGAMDLRQNLNNTLNNYTKQKGLDQADYQSTQFIGGLKNVLNNDVIDANASNVNPDDLSNFKQSWENANQTHQNLQAFKQTTNAAGAPIFSNVLRTGVTGNQSPEGAILNEFMPTPAQTGTNEYQNLSNLYGSQPQAQQALTAYALRNANSKGDADKSVMNFYQNQSPEQRQFLFANTPAQPALQAASQGVETYGAPTQPGFNLNGLHHFGLHYGLPGGIGFGAGLAMGLPWEQAVGLGAGAALGAKGIGKAIQKTATPGLVNRAMNYGQSAVQPSGLIPSYLLNPTLNGAPAQ